MLVIIAAFLFSYYFVNVAMIPQAIKKGFKMHPGARLKPFDCVTCLSVWSAAGFYFMPQQWIEFIAVIFASGFIGKIIK